MFSRTIVSAGLLAAVVVNMVNAVPTISTLGNKFFYSNGTQYFMKGKNVPASLSLEGGLLTSPQELHIN